MKIGDIVWTEAYGHISKWVVLRLKDNHGFIKLYHIQEDDRLIDRDEFFNATEDAILATEAEAIQEAVNWENREFECRLFDHNRFLENKAKKLGQIKESEVKK